MHYHTGTELYSVNVFKQYLTTISEALIMASEHLPMSSVTIEPPVYVKCIQAEAVSSIIHPSSLVPLYDMLKFLTSLGATITIAEMDESAGRELPCQPIVYTDEPQRHYDLDEMLITIIREGSDHRDLNVEALRISPLRGIFQHFADRNGCVKNRFGYGLETTLVVAKPLFYDILAARMRHDPEGNWTPSKLYRYEARRVSDLLLKLDGDSWRYNDDMCNRYLDESMFQCMDLITRNSDLINKNNILFRKDRMRRYGRENYEHTVTLQAQDFLYAPNMEVLTNWIQF